jgi:hypothetical protein
VIDYLLNNKESKQMFPELLKQLNAAKEEQIQMEKKARRKASIKQRLAAKRQRQAEENAQKDTEELQYSPIKKGKSTPIRTDDMDVPDLDQMNNKDEMEIDEVAVVPEQEMSNFDPEEMINNSNNDSLSFAEEDEDMEMKNLPTIDQRDIEYGFVIVGQFIKTEYLEPFLRNYFNSPDYDISWTELLELINEDDSEDINEALYMAGFNDIELLRSCIIFYQTRNEICHPHNALAQSKEEIALNLRSLRSIMDPQQYQGIKEEVQSLTVNGETVDIDVIPEDYVPLRKWGRPDGFVRAIVVEATLASAKLYQLLFTALIKPLVYELGVSKADHINAAMMKLYQQDNPENGVGWSTVYRLRYHLRPLRNRLCHSISSFESVVAYAKVLSVECPRFREIMMGVIETAQNMIANKNGRLEESFLFSKEILVI